MFLKFLSAVPFVIFVLFTIAILTCSKDNKLTTEPTDINDPGNGDTVIVTFPDPNFEAVIREKLKKPTGEITNVDLLTITAITYFDANNREISNITGIESCSNLTYLNLRGNNIRHISPVLGLINLEYLNFRSNNISHISDLSDLINLEWLYLDLNQISDISPVSGLINLKGLGVEINQISDIYPLVQNTGIADGDYVNLRNNPLNDLSINTYIPELKTRGVFVAY